MNDEIAMIYCSPVPALLLKLYCANRAAKPS